MSEAEAPLSCVCTGYGINADAELAEALRRSGARVEQRHIAELLEEPRRLERYRILAFPGGFSFGDHLGSGKVLATMIRLRLSEGIRAFLDADGLVIGICNGFQVLVKAGLLPNLDGSWSPSVSLVHNDRGVFENSWVRVRAEHGNGSPWLRGIGDMDLPIRNGEGRFVTASAELLKRLERSKAVAFRYLDRNPNGSANDIAGITDSTGRILGLMPHPEAFLTPYLHPAWRRGTGTGPTRDGLGLFRNAVRFASGPRGHTD
jgi:phosphoribosylformylglycinamidine synthase